MNPSGVQVRPDASDLKALRALCVSMIRDERMDDALDLVIGLLGELRNQNDTLQVRLKSALRRLYGRRSEKLSAEQLELFERVLGESLAPTATETPAATDASDTPADDPTAPGEAGGDAPAREAHAPQRRALRDARGAAAHDHAQERRSGAARLCAVRRDHDGLRRRDLVASGVRAGALRGRGDRVREGRLPALPRRRRHCPGARQGDPRRSAGARRAGADDRGQGRGPPAARAPAAAHGARGLDGADHDARGGGGPVPSICSRGCTRRCSTRRSRRRCRRSTPRGCRCSTATTPGGCAAGTSGRPWAGARWPSCTPPTRPPG